MYLTLIILALLFLAPGKTSSVNFPLMQISDALPVQFWPTGCATYNQHEAPGVHHKCFCAPWECGDDIKVQFTDDPSQNFSLEIYSTTNALLGSVDFEEPYIGVYEATLNLAQDSPDICDQQIQLKIKRNAGLQGVGLPSLSTWLSTSVAGTDIPWSLGSSPNVTLHGIGAFPPDSKRSEILYTDYAFIPGNVYNITVIHNRNIISGSSNPRTSTLEILDGSNVVQFSTTLAAASGSNELTISFTATSSCTRIGFFHNSGNNVSITVNSVTGQMTVGDSEIVAQTDCLDIRQEHEESILLTYSNHRNFSGLNYSGTSPQTYFQVRIPSVFFHQRFPEEDETMELSSELVTLSGTLRKQRQLSVDYVPYYFHEKLKLILKHQILVVFNRQWVKQEAYEIVEGNRQYPLKKANCWLSEKEFVHRNIL